MKRVLVPAISLAVLVVLLVAIAQASPSARSSIDRVEHAGGSLQFTINNPSPPCISDSIVPGSSCTFELHGRLKVKSAPDCRARDVKIFRLNPSGHIDTPNTNSRGVSDTTLGGSYTAEYPGNASNEPFFDVTGGTRMSFRAVAPRFKTFVASNPFRPLVCKTLRSGVDDAVAPTPPPPPPRLISRPSSGTF